MRLFRDWAPGAPDDITAALNLTTAPPLPVVPEDWHGRKVIALIAVSAGPVDQAEAHFRAFREAAEPVADLLGPMPYMAMQTLIDPALAEGDPCLLQGHEPGAARRRADRAARTGACGRPRTAVRDPRPPDGWRRRPRGRRRRPRSRSVRCRSC